MEERKISKVAFIIFKFGHKSHLTYDDIKIDTYIIVTLLISEMNEFLLFGS